MATPTNVQSMASFASTINLDFGGNTLTGVATGNALISGGVLDMTGADFKKISYANTYLNLPLGQTFQFLTRYKPGYSDTPTARQNIFNTTQLLGVGNNQCYLYHSSSTGQIELYMTNSSNTQIVYLQGTFQPTAGTWYELSFVYDFNSGFASVYVDDTRVAHVSGLSLTRLPFNSYFQIGGDASDNATHVANFSMKEMILYNTAVDTGATRATGYTMPSLSNAVQLIPDADQVKTGVSYNYGASTGTYTGSDRWSDPGITNVRTATAYKADSTSNNRTGTLDVPSLANTKTGVTGDGGTGTYDGSDRWTDPGESNVLLGVEYKANSLTNNQTGTLEASEPDYPDESDVRLDVEYGDGEFTGTYAIEVEDEDESSSDFPSIESAVVDQTIQLLGRDVSYTCYGYAAQTIKAVFDNSYVDIEGIVSLKPILRINIASLAATPRKGDLVTVSSTNYRVLESRIDGYGGSTLILQKV